MDTERYLLSARQVMQRAVITLRPDQEIVDAVQTLLQTGISGAPVVSDGQVVGMFSERDSLHVLAAASYETEPSGTVGDHMRKDVETCAPNADIFQLARCFEKSPVRRIPVVDERGELVGLVLRSAVMTELHRLYHSHSKLPPAPPKTPYERIRLTLRGA
jgi:CBS domain-containing protein